MLYRYPEKLKGRETREELDRVIQAGYMTIINKTDYTFKLHSYEAFTGYVSYMKDGYEITGAPEEIMPNSQIKFGGVGSLFVGPSGRVIYSTEKNGTKVYIDFEWDVPKYSSTNYFFDYVTPEGAFTINAYDFNIYLDPYTHLSTLPYWSDREVFDVPSNSVITKGNINTVSPIGDVNSVHFIIT